MASPMVPRGLGHLAAQLQELKRQELARLERERRAPTPEEHFRRFNELQAQLHGEEDPHAEPEDRWVARQVRARAAR